MTTAIQSIKKAHRDGSQNAFIASIFDDKNTSIDEKIELVMNKFGLDLKHASKRVSAYKWALNKKAARITKAVEHNG